MSIPKLPQFVNHSELIHQLELAYPKALHLLTPYWREQNKKYRVSSVGFCYIAAEAAYHRLGGKSSGWSLFVASYLEDGVKHTHWWLENQGIRLDPTASQYILLNEQPPYHLGRKCGFLTSKISKRANELFRLAFKEQMYV